QGDVGDLTALQGGGDLQHLAHAGTALGPFVADDDDIALADRAVLDGVEGVFLAVEDAGGAFEDIDLVARQLDDRAFGGDVAIDDGVGAAIHDRLGDGGDHDLTGGFLGLGRLGEQAAAGDGG